MKAAEMQIAAEDEVMTIEKAPSINSSHKSLIIFFFEALVFSQCGGYSALN